jgi:hypothetical protein
MKIFKEGNIYMIAGTTIAFLGVAFARLIAPEFAGMTSRVMLISGYALSLAGIIIIARAASV